MKEEVIKLDTVARIMMEKTILEPGSTTYLEIYKQLKEASVVRHRVEEQVGMPMPPMMASEPLDWREMKTGVSDKNVGEVNENPVA